jgi:hypothetical protein
MRTNSIRGYVAMVLLGALAGFVLVETLMRVVRVTPRTQIVRGHGLHTVDGVPIWEGSTDRQNRTCVEQHPERQRILVFGSSISYGTDLTAEETFTTALQARLNQLGPTPGFCVLNFAQPGFQFEQKNVVAHAEVPRYRPAMILWESWVEWRQLRMIGNTAYSISDYALRPDGLIGISGVPDSLNRVLFLHSRLYEYLALAYGDLARLPAEQENMVTFANTRLPETVRLAQSMGSKLVFYFAPPLDRPFADTSASPTPSNLVLLDYARAHGIPTYFLAQELIDQDYREVRLDPCCHFNAKGHRGLAAVMERIVLEQLEKTPGIDG